jgi:hypothetical protein
VDDVAALCLANELMTMGEAKILAVLHNTGHVDDVSALFAVLLIVSYRGRGGEGGRGG